VDDVTKRVFDLAKGCLEELYKQKEYIGLLEAYIEELENGVEMPTTESVQLEQPMEMEESNDDVDNRRPSAVRRRNEKRDQGSAGSIDSIRDESHDSDGGSGSTETSADNLDK